MGNRARARTRRRARSAAIGHRAKVREGEGLEGIDSQIRGQWSGDLNWASGKALQTEEKEECTMKSVEALIPFQPEAAKA